jgi:CDP-glucose 4,6-dehydratase
VTASHLDVYRGQRVLVTGHTGFKGAWLTSWLQRLGAQVTGLALAPQPGSLFLRCQLEEGLHHHLADVRSLEAVRAVVDKAAPDLVFHLAAQALVRRSFADPLETVATNVMGTAHVLEALRLAGAPCACVVVTSDKCYHPAGKAHAHLETDPLGGHDPYSMSKGAAELVVTSWRHSFFEREGKVLVASARAGNCIGGGDVSADRLVVDALRAFDLGQPVEVRNPGHIRPWQHVLDPLHGYLALGSKLLVGPPDARRAYTEGFNFGPLAEEAATVRQVVELLIEFSRGGRWVDVSGQAHPPENPLLMLDTHKARARLPWVSLLPLRDAVAWTVQWHQAAVRGGSVQAMRELTLAQLQAFTERIAS